MQQLHCPIVFVDDRFEIHVGSLFLFLVRTTVQIMEDMNIDSQHEQVFQLKANPSIKRYNVARFDSSSNVDFSTRWTSPVVMYREPEKIDDSEDEAEEKAKEDMPAHPAYRKRRRRRKRIDKTPGWIIEDQDGSHKLNGTVEGGQPGSNYMLMIESSPGSNELSVMPVEHWFRFKKPVSYRTLTLEEAEEVNNEKKRKVERWLMKHKLAGEDHESPGEGTISKSKTPVTSGPAPAQDIFADSSKVSKRGPKSKPVGGATGEEGGDFEEKFDDDESDAEINLGNDMENGVMDSSSEEEDVLPSGGLSATGQAMKDLLKKGKASSSMSFNKDKLHEGDDFDEDDEAIEEDGQFIIKRDLGGNIIRIKKPTPTLTRSLIDSGTMNTSGDTNVNHNKRSREEEHPHHQQEQPAAKQLKTSAAAAGSTTTPASSSSSSSSTVATRLTEANVQQELIRYGGRMKTRDLLKKFKKVLISGDDKALMRDILRTSKFWVLGS